jgi:hypothetical protein
MQAKEGVAHLQPATNPRAAVPIVGRTIGYPEVTSGSASLLPFGILDRRDLDRAGITRPLRSLDRRGHHHGGAAQLLAVAPLTRAARKLHSG